MQLRIFGFSAALIVLTVLGLVLVQVPPYGEPEPPEEEAPVQEAPEPEPEPEVGAEEEVPEEELAEEAEEPSLEELRQQAEDAQRRVAEHLEAARRAQEEALQAQRRAGLLPEPVEEEEAPAEAPASIEELTQRIEELEARLAEMQAMQEISDEEVAAMEDELEYLEERGAFLEENRQQRIVQLDQGIDSLESLFRTLTDGESDIDGALAELSQSFQSNTENAFEYAGEEEARLTELAQRSVEMAREALVRRDLYAARVAIGAALYQARAARRAAETTGPNPLSP